MRLRRRCERGAILVLMALLMSVLVVIVAIVVDLGATRSDRRGAQAAADNAAAAAARSIPQDGVGSACEVALAFLAAGLDTTAFAPSSAGTCATIFSSVCTSATAPRVVTAASGEYVARIYSPVRSSHSTTQHLMSRASTIGGGAIAAAASDGAACNRVGVELTTTSSGYFGGIVGANTRTSTIHAVAFGERVPGENRPVNLAVLNRTECSTLTVGGSSIVNVEIPTDAPALPGVAAIDSNSTAPSPSCGGTKAAIEVSGVLRVKGLCEGGATTCGILEAFRTPPAGGACSGNSDVPVCSSGGSGVVSPKVTKSDERVTREPFDHLYNCKPLSGYATQTWFAAQPITGCVQASTQSAYVDNMYAFASAISATTLPPGWTVLPNPSVPGFDSCNVSATAVVPAGNYFVNCTSASGLSVSGDVTFGGGNVVFGGKVSISGSVKFNQCAVPPVSCSPLQSDWIAGDDFDESSYSSRHAWVYAKAELGVSGTMDLPKVTVFIDTGGTFNKTGSATTTWVAPDELTDPGSAGPFDDLALWSRSTQEHTFRGGGTSNYEGVFFGPSAPFNFSGGSPMNMRKAQFAADKMRFTGSTTYTMSPVASRAVPTKFGFKSTLIR